MTDTFWPVEWDEALDANAIKALFPTGLTSADLEQFPAEITEQAFMSARVMNLEFLQEAKDIVHEFMSPEQVIENGVSVTRGVSLYEAKNRLREILRKISHKPAPGKRGGMEDLASDQRLKLIVDMNVNGAYGYAQHASGTTADSMTVAPCWELFRLEHRMEPRDWPSVWKDAGGEFYPGKGAYPEGRMIASKADPIWVEISRFGKPYPPFDYNSGMWLRPVFMPESAALGVLRGGQAGPAGSSGAFGADYEMSVAGLDGDLLGSLKETMPKAKVKGGKVKL